MVFQVQILCGLWPRCLFLGLAPARGNQCKALHVPVSRAPLGELIGATQVTLQPSPAAFHQGQGGGELWPAVGPTGRTFQPGVLQGDVQHKCSTSGADPVLVFKGYAIAQAGK